MGSYLLFFAILLFQFLEGEKMHTSDFLSALANLKSQGRAV